MQGLEGLEIKASPTAGKGLFTTKVFAPGDVVMDLERLLLAIPDPARAHDTCAWCFNWTGLPMLFAVGEDEGRIGDVKETHSWCTGCRAVAYCSKQCQSKAWKAVHKRECRQIKSLRLPAEKQLPVRVRAICQLVSGIENTDDELYKAMLHLESNHDAIKSKDPEQLINYINIAQFVAKVLGQPDTDANLERLTKIACIIMSNTFTLVAATFDPLGLMVDPRASRANHSCKPNVCMVFDGARVQLRALEAFKAGDEVLVSYINQSDPFRVRQAQLKSRYHFTCSCSRCSLGSEDPAEALLPFSRDFMEESKRMKGRSKTTGPPKDSQYFLGDSQELTVLGRMQEEAYQALSGKLQGPNSMPMTGVMLDALRPTGAFKPTRGPLPALLREHMASCLDMHDYNRALLAALQLYSLVDPVLHPQPFHPVRVVHTWTLSSLLRLHASEPGTTASRYCIAKRIDLSIVALAIFKEVYDQVPKSHGWQSGFGRMIAKAYDDLVADMASDGHTLRLGEVMQAASKALPRVKALAEDKMFEEAVNFSDGFEGGSRDFMG